MFNWYNSCIDRSRDEINLTRNTIYLWKDIVDVFEKNSNINKIGFLPSNEGWMWFNFFWARGNYLITCDEPIITDNRYYYESWLGSGDKNNGISYSIYSHDYKKYKAEEAIDIITKMR